MTFTLSMHCDNAAFEEDLTGEIGRILRTVVARLDDGSIPLSGTLRDTNGNAVGSFKVSA
jgi:hypothetical protein